MTNKTITSDMLSRANAELYANLEKTAHYVMALRRQNEYYRRELKALVELARDHGLGDAPTIEHARMVLGEKVDLYMGGKEP